VLADGGLPQPVQVLLLRLHASALRVALDDDQHPVRRFIDRLAFLADVLMADDTGLDQLTRYAQRLVDDMVREARQGAALFRWGLDRLAVLAQHALERRIVESAAQIAALGEMEARFIAEEASGVPSASPAIDVASLDTVPADLLPRDAIDDTARSAEAAHWLEGRSAGETLTLSLQSHWMTAQVLWISTLREVWLLHELPAGKP
jgi:ABC-type transporter Mla subunit MlaD